jgi:glycosyltransferase involved in cell wall biosynthesis
MTSYNRVDYTKLMVEEIAKRTNTPYRLIIVDNGSTDGSAQVITRLTEMGLVHIPILLDRNLGLERAKNIGLSCVYSDFYIDTDNDIIPESQDGTDWLAKLLKLIKDNPDYGGIACRSQALIGEPGDAFASCGEVREGNAGAHLRIMHTDSVRGVDGWNNYFTNRSEEKGIRQRLGKVGLKTGYARDIRCIHLFGDNWGYKETTDHFHREVWPPVKTYDYSNVGVDWKTCR